MKYHVTRVFDANNGETIEADSVEDAYDKAVNSDSSSPMLCHECSSEINLGDLIGVIIQDENGKEVYNDLTPIQNSEAGIDELFKDKYSKPQEKI